MRAVSAMIAHTMTNAARIEDTPSSRNRKWIIRRNRLLLATFFVAQWTPVNGLFGVSAFFVRGDQFDR